MFSSSSLSNQIKSPDDEDDEPEPEPEPEPDCDNSFLPKHSSIKQQPTFLTYNNYNHHFEHTFDFTPNSWLAHNQKSKSPDFDFEQLGFDLGSHKLKSNNRIEPRVVQSTGRKDRHSKVRTARGPRDRRVRLSPRTAIQFYDVQDRLGYDRPSKAIDWLIKEAKAAIDALNHHHSNAPEIENHGGFLIEKPPSSGFGFCIDGAAPPPPTPPLQAHDFDASADSILNQNYQQGFCSETNWELARLQKMLNWNSGNENSGNARGGGGEGYSPTPLHSPAAPISGHMFSQREPLQSSFINYSPIGNVDFPAFNFCNELLNVTASATLMKKDENIAFNRPSSTAPFLQYED